MRYEIALALLSAALIGAGWALRRHRLAPESAKFALNGARPSLAAILRRPF